MDDSKRIKELEDAIDCLTLRIQHTTGVFQVLQAFLAEVDADPKLAKHPVITKFVEQVVQSLIDVDTNVPSVLRSSMEERFLN